MARDPQTFDQWFDSPVQDKPTTTRKKTVKAEPEEDEAQIEGSETLPKKKFKGKSMYDNKSTSADGDDYKGAGNNLNRLKDNVRSTLNIYIKKIPDVKIMDDQIKQLETEAANYKSNGSTDNYNKTIDMLKDLKVKRSAITKVFKQKEYSVKNDEKKSEVNNRIKTSPVLKELGKKQKELEKAYDAYSTNSIMYKYRKLKKQIAIQEKLKETEVMDFDDLMATQQESGPKSQLQQDFEEACGDIGLIIGHTAAEVADMKDWHITQLLNEKIDPEKRKRLKNEIRKVQLEITREKSKLSEDVNVTDVLFEVFKFENENADGRISKEILAATHTPLVLSIAYRITQRLGMVNNMDEAISGGLFGLTKAINAWYEVQKLEDSALRFQDFANRYIAKTMERCLRELSNSSTSGSTAATNATFEKQRLENFLKYNPEFAEMDRELVNDLLYTFDSSVNKGLNIANEGDLSASISDEEGFDAFSVIQDSNYVDEYEAKENYTKLIKSVASLMEMFAVDVDKKTGQMRESKNKIFDKYNKKIFLMKFGVDFRKEADHSVIGKDRVRDYTEEDIAKEVSAMMVADGIALDKPISASAINTRFKTTLSKIQQLMEFKPEIKAGFEYLINYSRMNREAMNKMAAYREEITMAIEREELRELYADDEDILNLQLSDGSTLNDVFQISDENPLDIEIGSMFNDYM